MNPDTVSQWIIKASHDLKIGIGESTATDPATDMICFHMQQCVEKLLKAFIVFHEREMTRTHDIALLIEECLKIDSGFQILFDQGVDGLSPYGVMVRYPDDFYLPTEQEMHEAIAWARFTWTFVCDKIKIS